MESASRRARRGFALLELVIVAVIVATIAAIAIPRLSRGAEGAEMSALEHDLKVLNKALDVYAAEHQGLYPTAAEIETQLTKYTDVHGGNISDAPNPAAGAVFGPYVRRVPPVPYGANKGNTKISTTAGNGVGWIYDTDIPRIIPNVLDGGSVTPGVIESLGDTGKQIDDWLGRRGG